MTAQKYPEAFNKTIDFLFRPDIEGGYSNDPQDPGGETNFGIAKRYHPDVDIRNLTKEAAKAIYFKEYWEKYHCALLSETFAPIFMDSLVNPGPGFATKSLQTLCGLTPDGIIGAKTKACMKSFPEDNISMFLTMRALYYISRPGFQRYGKGWLKRTYALALSIK